MEELKPCLPFKRFTRTYEGGEAWLPAREISLMGDGELTGPAIDRLALYESLLQMEPAEVALKLRRAAPENDYAALKAQYDEINRYNISCTKKIDELLAKKVTAPENKLNISEIAVAKAIQRVKDLIGILDIRISFGDAPAEFLNEKHDYELAIAALQSYNNAAPENKPLTDCPMHFDKSGCKANSGFCIGEKCQNYNPPLTLEQLREMNADMVNRPWVWIEVLKPYRSAEKVSGYYRAQSDYTRDRAFCCGWPGVGFAFEYEDYGKMWIAYVRKPEGAEFHGTTN